LLVALAEQLKLPLLQITQSVELASLGGTINLKRIETVADMALSLLDSYVLSVQLAEGQLSLNLEPVSLAAVLHDSAARLERLARQYHCALEIDLGGRYSPVMADRKGLEAAVTALGQSFIEAQAQHGADQPRLVLATRRGRRGIVAGVYGNRAELTAAMFHRAKLTSGRARQPLPSFGHGPGAGVFVADALLSAMSGDLRVARLRDLTGLAVALTPSAQLRLV
jgi:hypothetical protein